MTAVPALPLTGPLAVGVLPGFGGSVSRAVDDAGSGGAVVRASHRPPADLASTAPALGLAAPAATRPGLLAAPAGHDRCGACGRTRRGLRGLASGGHRRAGGADLPGPLS